MLFLLVKAISRCINSTRVHHLWPLPSKGCHEVSFEGCAPTPPQTANRLSTRTIIQEDLVLLAMSKKCWDLPICQKNIFWANVPYIRWYSCWNPLVNSVEPLWPARMPIEGGNQSPTKTLELSYKNKQQSLCPVLLASPLQAWSLNCFNDQIFRWMMLEETQTRFGATKAQISMVSSSSWLAACFILNKQNKQTNKQASKQANQPTNQPTQPNQNQTNKHRLPTTILLPTAVRDAWSLASPACVPWKQTRPSRSKPKVLPVVDGFHWF